MKLIKDELEDFLLTEYIPYVVRYVVAKYQPITPDELVEFSQALYKKVEEKRSRLLGMPKEYWDLN